MYSYYFVTNMWPKYKKNLWWKKHVTQLQMVSFLNKMAVPLLLKTAYRTLENVNLYTLKWL